MSIATELEALATNLGAAKSAVTAKGGTVGDTGLAGLATEIGTIPSSGGGGGIPDWGELSYYSVFSVQYAVDYAENCTVSNINASVYEQFLASQGGVDPSFCEFNYSDGVWDFGFGATTISPSDMASVTGITVSIDDPSQGWANFTVAATAYVDKTSPVETAVLSSTEYANLGGSQDSYSVGSKKILRKAVKGFTFGIMPTSVPQSFFANSGIEEISFGYNHAITSIGTSFLSGCSNFNSPISLPASVTSIGNYFLYNAASFNQPLALSSQITTIPQNFLTGCTSFNQPLALPNGVTAIGASFLQNCKSFNQPLILPRNLSSIGSMFMMNLRDMTSTVSVGALPSSLISSNDSALSAENTSAPAYVTGITLSGATANAWKTALPDRSTSSPVRKLLVE